MNKLPVLLCAASLGFGQTVRLDQVKPGLPYSLLVSVSPGTTTHVELSEAGRILAQKTLHPGDADFYLPFSTRSTAPQLRIDPPQHYKLVVNRLPDSPQIKRGGNHTWQTANAMTLGQTVFASSDEIEYIPAPGATRKQTTNDVRGEDWYKFRFDFPRPKLVFFQVELMDRDDLPVDVSIFRSTGTDIEEFLKGQDPVAITHEVQALPGNKFAPRILDPGDYFIRVRANHPEYKLRTRVYEAPPYADPRDAVRTAVDYIMGAGDSWFANTPRRGGTLDRITPVHQETSLCVGCHPSHFSQRAQLYAAANGYPVTQRQQLQFLEERFYNNPRPFYGFEDQGAVWARVISAPANVLSRMSLLTSMFEQNVSKRPMPEYHAGVANYLDLYYSGRTALPPDETNGNTPLVSTFEVGWYSWKTTHDARLPDMMAAAEVKNMNDLDYQTLALADIDRAKYKDKIAANAARIISLQRPDGQWSMKFEPNEPEVEFATGHALWALQAAGIPVEEPHVAKAIGYLMQRQQSFGGWMDPLQSFENFRTPFRETQFAVLALSSYFPLKARAAGWGSVPIDKLSSDPVTLLNQLDDIWDRPSPAVAKQVEAAAQSNEVLIRQAALEALGRLALPGSIPVMLHALGDESKLVQRTAAWGLRQEAVAAPILNALKSPDARTRWGATRIFAHHFAALARQDDIVEAVARLAENDPVTTVRMQAIRGLWQSWFWNAHTPVRNRIEDVILAGLKTPQNPWIQANLEAAVYNLADENIRYLYNNWVTLLPREEDRTRAIEGRLAIEARLADKFTVVLTTGTNAQKKELLAALTDPKQRRADIYDVESDLSSEGSAVYNRIGNDIEQIAFFGPSGAKLARALTPLTTSSDPEMRRLSLLAAQMVRETPYAAVDKIVGGRSAEAIALMPPPPSKPVTTTTAAPVTVTAHLDEGYFRSKVEPILNRKGEDGYACVNCHATHTLFNATWQTVMNVVDTQNPENSLLLRKPTSTAESEGVVGAKTTAHGGGRRWQKGSTEYQTILNWISGAATK